MVQGSDGAGGALPADDEPPAAPAPPGAAAERDGVSERDKAETEIEAGDVADELADFA